jgi:hypothetical protein
MSLLCILFLSLKMGVTAMEIVGLPFCTQLPDGLCQLPSLETLMIDYAVAISRVGPEFQRQTAASRNIIYYAICETDMPPLRPDIPPLAAPASPTDHRSPRW